MKDNLVIALICVGGFLCTFLPLYLFADPGISPFYGGNITVSFQERQQSVRQDMTTKPQELSNSNDYEEQGLDEQESADGIIGEFVESIEKQELTDDIEGDIVDELSDSTDKNDGSYPADAFVESDVHGTVNDSVLDVDGDGGEQNLENAVNIGTKHSNIENVTPQNGGLESGISVQTFQYEQQSSITTVFLIKNNNKTAIYVEIYVTVRDRSGQMIDSDHDSSITLSPGASIPLFMSFDNVDWSASYEYILSAGESLREDASSALGIETAKVDDGILVNVKNNGKRELSSCYVYVMFYEKGKLVYCNYGSVGDMNGRIAKGAPFSTEIGCYGKTFDDFVIYPFAEYVLQ